MKTVLMSIQPYYAYLETKGIKTIEVRKTEPKDKDWSGKVKVYVSQNKKSFNRIPKEDREWFSQYLGKVAYEFACNKVDKVINHGSNFKIIDESIGYTNRVAEQSRLDFHDLKKYLETKDGYAWHITDLKVYDKPKELSDFRKLCIMSEMPYCPACKFGNIQYSSDEVECSRDIEGASCEWLCTNFVKRPPQIWQYIQELED